MISATERKLHQRVGKHHLYSTAALMRLSTTRPQDIQQMDYLELETADVDKKIKQQMICRY